MKPAQAELTDGDRLWPVEPGRLYAVELGGYMRGTVSLFVTGYAGWLQIRPDRCGRYLLRLELHTGKVTFTPIVAHDAVARSLAATMLSGAARAAGLKVTP